MPKAGRKRRATSTRRAETPKMKKVKTENLDVKIEEPVSTYYDLFNKPNESLKSKKTGQFIKSPKIPKNLRLAADWDVRVGDVLSWSDFRATETYFVTNGNELLKNVDSSGSGYLTIPLSITSIYSDAINQFRSVIEQIGPSYVSAVELLPSDSFFSNNFSKTSLPKRIKDRSDVRYSFDPNEQCLNVSSASNPQKSQQFPLERTTTKEIVDWISTIDENETSVKIQFDFQGRDICRKAPRQPVSGLPTGWRCEQQGSLTISDEKINGFWKCSGPKKTEEKARKAIEQYYQGFPIVVE